MILTGLLVVSLDQSAHVCSVEAGSVLVLVILTGVEVVSAGVLLDASQSDQVCSVEAGSVLVLVIFTGVEVVSAGVLLEASQSDQVCSSLVEEESAGLLLVLVILTGVEVVSAGVLLEASQSDQVCSSLELEDSAGLLLVLVILTGVDEVLVILTGVLLVLSAGVELDDASQSDQVCSSLELEDSAGLLLVLVIFTGVEDVVPSFLGVVVGTADLLVKSAGLEDSATALLDQSFQPERA